MAPNSTAAKLRVASTVPATDDDFLTVDDVARMLKLKPKQVYGLKIPCVRVSRRAMRFRRSQFEQWLQARAS